MRNVPPLSAGASPSTPTHSPSVPISLYREVASELQTTKKQVESLKTQNQQLVEQNQKLRVEIERVVQVALRLRQIADAQNAESGTAATALPGVELRPENGSQPANAISFGLAKDTAEPGIDPNRLFTEQEAKPQRTSSSERFPEVSGWWLILVVFVIVITAFGMGFAIVSPLLPKR
ncbi:MAG TPA: hypothetical protein IGS53_07605 [Leptolyngbyaceae cyanobacterium M33_DOE_097]|uniref:Uncharacterized protein n=1 Tax=Oscillatoriales cyanobacterium SpSt-418 TaxID=2282169 RepID=A0A7C3KDX2_9CYAN|nr:hypothetical protein [Leptolyngbyaceae cyanobacterium M33_DOE_097]